MPQALVCTVGGQPQPVVNALRQNRNFSRVYFLCSTGDAANASDRTLEEATKHTIFRTCSRCHQKYKEVTKSEPIVTKAGLEPDSYSVARIVDPDELTQVLGACQEIAEDIVRRWPEQAIEVSANYTGGTKTMSVGLAVYALRAGWSLQLNRTVDGRHDLTRIEAGDVAQAQDVSGLMVEAAERRAQELAARYDYEGAGMVLEEVITRERLSTEDRQRLVKLHLRCQVCAARDRLDYARARELARQHKELAREFAGPLSILLETIELFNGKTAWPKGKQLRGLELITDLRENAERAASRGRYDEAVARLYRVTELIAQLKLRRDHGIDTSRVDPDDPRIPEPLRVGRTGDRLKLGLRDAFELLVAEDDPLGRYYASNREAITGLLMWRNTSPLAHGLEPVGHDRWREVAPRWRVWLDGAMAECD